MKQQQILVPVIITAVVAGGVGFFGGTKYQQMQRGANFQQFANGAGGRNFGGRGGSGAFGQGNRNGGFRPVSGEILKADDTSITVKLMDGSSKIVLLSDKTAINKASEGAKADLTVGQKVAVFGTDNSDGSVTAQNIQLNPMMQQFGGPRTQPSGSPQPSPAQ